jgi:large subunit ribosomal protein L21
LHFLTATYGPAIRAPVRRNWGAGQSLSLVAGNFNSIDWKKPVRRNSARRVSNTGKKMFAVFKTGGKQYRVAAEDVLEVDKIKGAPGEIVEFGEVLVVGGDNVTLGTPTIAGATVAAEVLQQARGPKIIAFKKRRRKNSRRKRGHRQEFTLLRITEILTDGNKPSKTARPKAEAAPISSAEVQPGATEAATVEAAAEPRAKAKKPTAKAKKPAAKREPKK